MRLLEVPVHHRKNLTVFRVFADHVHQSELHTVQGAGVIHQADGQACGVSADLIVRRDAKPVEVPIRIHPKVSRCDRDAHHLPGTQGSGKIQAFQAIGSDAEDGGGCAFDGTTGAKAEAGDVNSGDVIARAHAETGEVDAFDTSSRAHTEAGESETGHVSTGAYPEEGGRSSAQVLSSGETEPTDADPRDVTSCAETESTERDSGDVSACACAQATDHGPTEIIRCGYAHKSDAESMDFTGAGGQESDRRATNGAAGRVFGSQHRDVDSSDILYAAVTVIQPHSAPILGVSDAESDSINAEIELRLGVGDGCEGDDACDVCVFHGFLV